LSSSIEAAPAPPQDGAHRCVPPEITLSRLRPMMPQMGITRVAVLTGLDVVGVPVAAAYRPNSRSIAVHQGKGVTLAAAKVSAVMEGVECWHGENADVTLRLGNATELVGHGEIVAPERLPRTGQGNPASDRFLWTQARDLVSGSLIWVPFELVSADFTVPAPAGFGLFRQATNGLAAGNTIVEAMLQGVYECVERDAVALWHLAPSRQAACCVDPASIDGPVSCWLFARLAAAQVAVRIWDVTTDIGLPVFLVLVSDDDGVAGVEPEFGAGCHASADAALARALAEAAQARVTRISGARDDFTLESFAPAARAERRAVAQGLRRSAPARVFRSRSRAATPEADLDDALAGLRRAGIPQITCVDLSRPEIGIPVVRIIAPDLEGLWEGGGHPLSARARAAA
jgi:ribosomal protein S12 methylthiotransferase accessory factor